MTYEVEQLGKEFIVVTPTMETMGLIVDRSVKHTSMMVWVGAPGTGKTTTARYLTNGMAFGEAGGQGHYFNSPPLPQQSTGNRPLRLLEALLADLTGGSIRRGGRVQPLLSAVAAEVLGAMEVKNVSVLCIDEAGLLHPDALEGLIYLLDEAKRIGREFTCILIGMMGLPEHLRMNQRLDRRVTVRKRFAPLQQEDFGDFIRSFWQTEGVVPPAVKEQEAFIGRLFKASQGNINAAVVLMRSVVDAATVLQRDQPTLATLNAVVTLASEDRAAVMASAGAGGKGADFGSGTRRRKTAVVAVGE